MTINDYFRQHPDGRVNIAGVLEYFCAADPDDTYYHFNGCAFCGTKAEYEQSKLKGSDLLETVKDVDKQGFGTILLTRLGGGEQCPGCSHYDPVACRAPEEVGTE